MAGEKIKTFIDEEIESFGMDYDTWRSYGKILTGVGLLTVDSRPQSILSILKMHKIYVNRGNTDKVRDILLANEPFTRQDFQDAVNFYAAHHCFEDGAFIDQNGTPIDVTKDPIVVNNPAIQEIVDVENTYMQLAGELIEPKDLGVGEDFDELIKKKKAIENFRALYLDASQSYEQLRSSSKSPFKDTFAYNKDLVGKWGTRAVISIFNSYQILPDAAGLTYSTAFAHAYLARTLNPLIKGKSFDEIQKMYPVNTGRDNILSTMIENIMPSYVAFASRSVVTLDELKEFRHTGEIPERLKPCLQEYQHELDEGFAVGKRAYNNAWINSTGHNAPPIEEYNLPAPPLADRDGVPAFESAAKKIAEDSRSLLESQLGKELGENKDKILADYANIVEVQVIRNLLESGYAQKCKAGDINVLNANLQDFVDGKTDKLPDNFTKDIVSHAQNFALDGVRDFYPDQEATLDKFFVGKLVYTDARGREPYTSHELSSSPIMQSNLKDKAVSKVMENAGLRTVNREISAFNIVKLHKMYAHPELARDVLLCRAPVTDADVKEAVNFFLDHPCTTDNGSIFNEDGTWVDKDNAAEVIALSDNYYKAFASLEVEDLINPDTMQIDRKNADLYNNLATLGADEGQSIDHFREPVNGKVDFPVNEKDRARLSAAYSLATFLDKTMSSPRGNYASMMATTMLFQMVSPVLKGRTIDDLARMYANREGHSLLNELMYIYAPYVKQGLPEVITEQELIDYQETGKLPDGVDTAKLQQFIGGMFGGLAESLAGLPEVKPYNLFAPTIFDHAGVPNFEDAARRIGQDAQSVINGKLGGIPAEERLQIAEYYGRIVENQVKRLLIEDGYVEKCRQAGNFERLEADTNNFINGGSVLPDNISKDIIDRAEQIALAGVKDFHSKHIDLLERINLSLSSEYDIRRENDLALPKAEDIANITATAKLDASLERNIRNLNLSQLGDTDISNITRAFDNFVVATPWLAANANSAVITDNLGNVTQTFYIDGKPVNNYLLAKVPDYGTMPEERKQAIAKAAIMQCLVSDRNSVDVKNYVITPDGKCGAKVSNVVYADRERRANGFFRRRRSEARARGILAGDTVARKVNENLPEYLNKVARAKISVGVQNRLKADRHELTTTANSLAMQLSQVDPGTTAIKLDKDEDKVFFSTMYTLRTQRAAGNATDKDVLLNDLSGNIDVDSVSEFFDTHTTSGVEEVYVNDASKNLKDILAINEDFMRTAVNADIDGIVNFTNIEDVNNKGYEIAKMAETAANMKQYFAAYTNALKEEGANKGIAEEYNALARTYSYYVNTVDMLSDMSFAYGKDKTGLDRALAATLMYNAVGPVLKGKSPRQLEEIYPQLNGKSYLDHLSGELNTFVSEFTEEYGLTYEDVQEFQRSGKLPDRVNDARFQQMYDRALDNAKRSFIRSEGRTEDRSESKLKPVYEAVPQFIAKNSLPDMQKATQKIAADAMASLASQYEKINGKQVDSQYQKEYGRLVEEQVRKLLIQDGYMQKCSTGLTEDLESNMQEFLTNGGTLPYNITKELVDQATANAVEGLNTLYPENKDILSRFNSELFYVNPHAPASSVDTVGLGNYRAPTDVDTTFKAPKDHERTVEAIRNIDFTVSTAGNMHEAVREFDNLMKCFPGYAESLKNPEVSKSCNGQVTNLFYIDGKPVEQYMETIIPGFKSSTAANKQNLTKVAIMKAIIDGQPPVDALYYSHDGKGNCTLNVRNVAYKRNLNSNRVNQPGKFKETNNEERAKRIYNANTATLNKVIMSVKEKYRAFKAQSAERAVRLGITPHAINVIPGILPENEEQRAARIEQEEINLARMAELQEEIERQKAYELSVELALQEEERKAKRDAELKAQNSAAEEEEEKEKETAPTVETEQETVSPVETKQEVPAVEAEKETVSPVETKEEAPAVEEEKENDKEIVPVETEQEAPAVKAEENLEDLIPAVEAEKETVPPVETKEEAPAVKAEENLEDLIPAVEPEQEVPAVEAEKETVPVVETEQELDEDKKVEAPADPSRNKMTVNLGEKQTTSLTKDPKNDAAKEAPAVAPKTLSN